jgi:hypothetical protein
MEIGSYGAILEMQTDHLFVRHGGIFLSLKVIMREMAVETPLCANIDVITIISK